MLVGAALAVFLGHSAALWVLLVLAAALSVVGVWVLQHALQKLSLPGLTAPFVVNTWWILLAAWHWPGLDTRGLSPAALGVPLEPAVIVFGWREWLQAALAGVGQIFFVNDAVAGAVFVLALAVHSRWCAVLALTGSLLAAAGAFALGADRTMVLQGLWGYSAALTAPAVGCVFLSPTGRSLAWALLAALCTVVVQGAALTVMGTWGMPVLTAPFVLTTWCFLLAWRSLAAARAEE